MIPPETWLNRNPILFSFFYKFDTESRIKITIIKLKIIIK